MKISAESVATSAFGTNIHGELHILNLLLHTLSFQRVYSVWVLLAGLCISYIYIMLHIAFVLLGISVKSSWNSLIKLVVLPSSSIERWPSLACRVANTSEFFNLTSALTDSASIITHLLSNYICYWHYRRWRIMIFLNVANSSLFTYLFLFLFLLV